MHKSSLFLFTALWCAIHFQQFIAQTVVPNVTFPMFDTNLGMEVRRRFTFLIPNMYRTSATPLTQIINVPVVLGLHGGFGNSIQFSNSNGFRAVAEQYKFIGIFPDGMSTNLGTEIRCWNIGSIPCRGENSALFIKLLITQLVEFFNGNKTAVLQNYPEFQTLDAQQNVRIDVNRIYQTGHSNGAFMTYFSAGFNSQVYAAIAPVSAQIGGYRVQGAPLSIAQTPSSAVNVIHFHGIYDMNVLLNGGETVEGTSNRVDLSLNDTISFWLRNNQCARENTFDFPYAVNTSSNTQVKLTQYSSGCVNNTNVYSVLYSADHGWGNMSATIQQANYPYNATSLAEAVWFMLSRHSKQVLNPPVQPSSVTPSTSPIPAAGASSMANFCLLIAFFALVLLF